MDPNRVLAESGSQVCSPTLAPPRRLALTLTPPRVGWCHITVKQSFKRLPTDPHWAERGVRVRGHRTSECPPTPPGPRRAGGWRQHTGSWPPTLLGSFLFLLERGSPSAAVPPAQGEVRGRLTTGAEARPRGGRSVSSPTGLTKAVHPSQKGRRLHTGTGATTSEATVLGCHHRTDPTGCASLPWLQTAAAGAAGVTYTDAPSVPRSRSVSLG